MPSNDSHDFFRKICGTGSEEKEHFNFHYGFIVVNFIAVIFAVTVVAYYIVLDVIVVVVVEFFVVLFKECNFAGLLQ